MGSRIVNGFFEFSGLSFPEVINQDFLSKGRRGERSHISIVGKIVLIFGRKNETVILIHEGELQNRSYYSAVELAGTWGGLSVRHV